MTQQPSLSVDRSRENSSDRSTWMPFGSFTNPSSMAQAAIEQDLEDVRSNSHVFEDRVGQEGYDSLLPIDSPRNEFNQRHTMAGSYHPPSYIGGVNCPPFNVSMSFPERGYLTEQEQADALAQERDLLEDNQLIPPQHPRNRSASPRSSIRTQRTSDHLSPSMSRVKSKNQTFDEESAAADQPIPSENSPLLGGVPGQLNGSCDEQTLNRKWEEAVIDGKIQTTWRREAKVLTRFSQPLIVTFLLQWSLTQTSIFTVGHIGKTELGAVSLGSMTASITGYALYQGLATSLDTLCAQAYGSGHRTLVGLQTQRMVFFLWVTTIPIAIIWASGTQILTAIIPDKEVARLAGLYLKILIAGAPGYAAFESGKRFVQAQGLFSANMYCLLFCTPLNALMHYLFVWQFKLGFVGAPIAVVITENLLPFSLITYVYFVGGRECWGGLTTAAFRNWLPMIKLAIPGLVMVLAEFLAFEALTLCAGMLGTEELAAQAVVMSVATLTFFIGPFGLSIAGSTRIANLIGASLASAAKTSAKVLIIAASLVGLINMVIIAVLRNQLPRLFTNDDGVIQKAAMVLPICAAFQLLDSLATNCNGILRGLGKQSIGGYVNVASYYAVAIPISLSTCFGLHWGMYGLWAGPPIGLALVSGIEGWVIYRTSWESAVEAARKRNDQG